MGILDKILSEYDEQEEPEIITTAGRGERQIIPTDNIIVAKLSKSRVSKFIKWSSSRYNAYTKSEVVRMAMDILNDDWHEHTIVVSSGSYCPSSTMTRTGTYLINGPEHYIASGKEVWNSETHVDDFYETERIEFR
jgi:hypothetical protein